MKARAAKRNEVEETIYRLRDKVRSAPEGSGIEGNEQKKEKLLAILSEVEDWILYTEEVYECP